MKDKDNQQQTESGFRVALLWLLPITDKQVKHQDAGMLNDYTREARKQLWLRYSLDSQETVRGGRNDHPPQQRSKKVTEWGGYMYSDSLSKELRMAVQPLVKSK